jgi:transcriptional regulator with XRE-family HTH domain
MLNLSRETIRRYEKDIYIPDKETLRKIAKVLGISIKSLLNGHPKTQRRKR